MDREKIHRFGGSFFSFSHHLLWRLDYFFGGVGVSPFDPSGRGQKNLSDSAASFGRIILFSLQ